MKNETVYAGDVRLAIDRIQEIAVLGIESTADTGQACSLIEYECMRLKTDLGIDGPLARDDEPEAAGNGAEPEASGNGAEAEQDSEVGRDGEVITLQPPARTFKSFDGMDITEVHGRTLWHVSADSARKPDELRFTRRLDDGGYSWWAVTPADVDYCHVHEIHGRALAFEFLDLVNNPERDDERVDGTLRFIAKGMAEAGRNDWRQQTIADGFWSAIGEYLIDGTVSR